MITCMQFIIIIIVWKENSRLWAELIFLKKFKIHHSQDESVCCHCFRLQELKRKERLSRLEKDELKIGNSYKQIA